VPAAAPESSYVLQPGDVLDVSVWKEKDLQRDVLVRPDGMLSFPLAGEIEARDKTVEQVRAEIAARLGRYIPNAVVAVAAKQINGNKIYVVGRVAKPGEYAATRYMSVMQALSLAGGMTPFAATGNIVILRRSGAGEVAIPFNYAQVESGRNLEQNILLRGGDVVVVP
jgi:polysaccharide export outer membrane protein